MIIEQAAIGDLDALVALENSVFEIEDTIISKRSFRYHLKDLLLVAKEEGELLGYILTLFPNKKTARIYSLAVSKEHRNKKIASKLLEKTLEDLKSYKKIVLEVKEENIHAIEFYEKYGFTQVKKLPGYYGKKDGIKMSIVIA